MVFQDARLFPHMSVVRNLRYGMRRAGSGPARIHLDDVVELLGIRHLLDRRPHSLSGGERQRVAIGRALLAQPEMLAMDEPLAALDAPRKAEILPFLARLKTALKLPILYVTHSTEELGSLADTLVLLEAGCVLAAGPLPDIIARSDLPLAMRNDSGSVLPATVMEHDRSRLLTRLQAGNLFLWIPLLERKPGEQVRIRVPAREVILAPSEPGPTTVHNVIPGRVRRIAEFPAEPVALVEIAVGSDQTNLLARVTPDAVVQLGINPGSPVFAMIKSMSIEILPG